MAFVVLPAPGTPLWNLANNQCPAGRSPFGPRVARPPWQWYAQQLLQLGHIPIHAANLPTDVPAGERTEEQEVRWMRHKNIIWHAGPYINLLTVPVAAQPHVANNPVTLNWLQYHYLSPPHLGFTDRSVYRHAIRNICESSQNILVFRDLQDVYFFAIHVLDFDGTIAAQIKNVRIENLTSKYARKGMIMLKKFTGLESLEVNLCPRCRDYGNGAPRNVWRTYKAPNSLRFPGGGQIDISPRGNHAPSPADIAAANAGTPNQMPAGALGFRCDACAALPNNSTFWPRQISSAPYMNAMANLEASFRR